MDEKNTIIPVPSFGFILCAATFAMIAFFLFLCIKKPCDFYYSEPTQEYGQDLVELYKSGYAIPESYIFSEKRYEEKR